MKPVDFQQLMWKRSLVVGRKGMREFGIKKREYPDAAYKE